MKNGSAFFDSIAISDLVKFKKQSQTIFQIVTVVAWMVHKIKFTQQTYIVETKKCE